jgi:hypothetical protein
MENHTITFEDWDHTCSDGCCVSWGTTVYFDGVEIGELDDMGVGEVMRKAFEKIGVEITVEYA